MPTIRRFTNKKDTFFDVSTGLDKGTGILEKYDAGVYEKEDGGVMVYELTIEDVETVVRIQRQQCERRTGQSAGLFGMRHNDALLGIVGNINQSFDGYALYPTVKTQAAQLMYSMVKSHPFADGNKRIALAVFNHFLVANKYAVDANGKLRIDVQQVADLVLMTAESPDTIKDFIVRQIEGVLERRQIE
jgi:death-on-curing family protein